MEMMSVEIAELANALAKAQRNFKPIPRTSTNPFFKSKYADLAAVIEGTKDALLDNGLVVTQSILPTEDRATVESILIHSSGQWLKSTVQLKPKSDTPQEMGSAITYCRRYGYSALLCIATEDDDDGNSATGKAKEQTTKKSTTNAPSQQKQASTTTGKATTQVDGEKGKPAPDKDMLALVKYMNEAAKRGLTAEKVVSILGADTKTFMEKGNSAGWTMQLLTDAEPFELQPGMELS